jgi:hypothetical protein
MHLNDVFRLDAFKLDVGEFDSHWQGGWGTVVRDDLRDMAKTPNDDDDDAKRF